MSQGEQVQGVADVFRASFTADNAVRNAAEQQLKQFELQPGFLPVLFQLILDANIELNVRQAAAIHAKNMIRVRWKPAAIENQPPVQALQESDKDVLKANLLEAVIFTNQHAAVQRSLLECTRLIVHHDFPESWPTLLPAVQEGIASQDSGRLYGSLLVLYAILNKYQYQHASRRGVQYEIAAAALPTLLAIVKHCTPNDHTQAAHMSRLCVKCFNACASVHTAPCLLEASLFGEWMTALLGLLAKQCDHTVEEGEIRDLNPWWKARKWASRVVLRMYEKFGSNRSSIIAAEDDPQKAAHLKQFTDWFDATWTIPALEVVINVLREGKNNGPLTTRVQTNCLNFVTLAVGQAKAFKQVLLPVVEEVMVTIVFPVLCHTDEDNQLMEDDPEEYIRRQTDIELNHYDPRLASLALLERMCTLRKKHCLFRFLGFVNGVLEQYSNNETSRDPRLKAGALRAIGALADNIAREPTLKGQIEQLVATHVVPELVSPHAFLRSIACWALTTFSSLTFSHCGGIVNVMGGVLRCLADQQLIVKYEAAKSLRFLIDFQGALEALRPQLLPVLDALFAVITDLGSSEELMDTIEKLLDVYGSEISPQCVELCNRLCGQFNRLFGSVDDDDEAAMTCIGIMRTLQTLLYSARDDDESTKQMELVICPLLIRTITQDTLEFMDNTLDIIAMLSVQREDISPTLWSLFPVMFAAFDQFAMDYAESMLIAMDNYISRATQVFVTSSDPDYAAMVMRMCGKAFGAATEGSCFEAQQMAKLLECAFQNTRVHQEPMHRFRQPMTELIVSTLHRLHSGDMSQFTTRPPTVINFSLLCMNALSGIIYNDPGSFVRIDESVVIPAIQLWMSLVSHLPRIYDKKCNTIALMSLVAIPAEQLPAYLQQVRPQLFGVLVNTLTALLQQQQQEASENSEDAIQNAVDATKAIPGDLPTAGEDEDSDADDDGEDEEGELDDEEDEDNEEKDRYLQRLREALAGLASEDEFDLDEAVEVTTPLDDVNEFALFHQLTHSLSTANPGAFEHLMSAVDQNQRQHVSQLAQHGAQELQKQMQQLAASEQANKPPYIAFA